MSGKKRKRSPAEGRGSRVEFETSFKDKSIIKIRILAIRAEELFGKEESFLDFNSGLRRC